jgi:hypothetical protein
MVVAKMGKVDMIDPEQSVINSKITPKQEFIARE